MRALLEAHLPAPAGDGATTQEILAGLGVWLLVIGAYLTFFWSLAGQTPGMRLLGISIEADGSSRLGFRRAVRRVIGLILAIIPFGLGLLRAYGETVRQPPV